MKLGVAILAAGQGTRMRSSLPKVLHPLAGKPLLAHVLDTVARLEANRVAVVYGHGGDTVRNALSERDVEWVEQSEQLGTGHALEQAMPLLAEMDHVLVLYGDVPLISEATLAHLKTLGNKSALALLTATLDNPSGYGRIVRDVEGRVLRIVEHKDASPEECAIPEINTGILLADQGRLADWLTRLENDNAQGEFYLTDVIAMAVDEGVNVETAQPETEEEILGVNDRVQLSRLERYYQHQMAQEAMRQGVTLADPARFDVRGEVVFGSDVFVDVNVVFEGRVEIGDGVSIGPNTLIRNSRIGDGTQIFANSVLEDAELGRDTRIGPFARLRPEARLSDRVHVGNFVEIKKSRVGRGSKINHLSYIGDAQVGGGVNIGAGTITCNYDGANKHQTIIGDNAFIGSDTQLVAPVTVGAGATIGAGSTITRDAPEETLTLSRSKQVSVKGWNRPVKKKAKD
ncbi:MAG TPA: UDP-N-acetylglucosamine diphosphorylase/glucosamine-1-phosphate N-acetyltransferase [Chromatiales bacterium]|nr:UDP-N-acetylglucosamine diphosphorylase/glucosamine-1-phosphate N-acetyltransferase [Chromatiales bacterium]